MRFKIRLAFQIGYDEAQNDKQTGNEFQIVARQADPVTVASACEHERAV